MTEFSLAHEHTLVREIMDLIERYHTEHGITCRPNIIRDTVLAVAALLHMETARLENNDVSHNGLEDTFSEKARERMADVLASSSNTDVSLQ